MKHYPVLHFREAFECFKPGNRSNVSWMDQRKCGILSAPLHPHFSEPLTLEGKPVCIWWTGGGEQRHLLTFKCWPTWISGHHSGPPRNRNILRYTLCSHSGPIPCGHAPALQQICYHPAGCSGTARDLQGAAGWRHHTSITCCNGNR